MSIAQSEFWSRLVQSGLADETSCLRYAAAFTKAGAGVSGSKPSADDEDAKPVASFLARTGVLTKFQASRLTQADDPGLRVGSFVMTSDQPMQPFSHWLPVQTDVADGVPASQNGGHDGPNGDVSIDHSVRRGFLLRVPLQGLDENLRGWLAAHSEVHGETLQPIELRGGAQADDAEQMVEIFSPVPEGGSLLKVLEAKQSLSIRKTVRIGIDLAHALQALHSAAPSGVAMAHGAVGADHVWVTPRGNAVLLRDPSSPARSPRSDQSSSWIERIEPPGRYAAPELADPQVAPTPAADLYSLGCLLFSVLVGRPPFAGDDDNELFAAHQSDLPAELIEAVQQGAAGNPILRVLAYAMAKDPAARFESGNAFAEALARAGEVASDKKTTKAKTTKSASKKPAAEKPNKKPVEARAEKVPATSELKSSPSIAPSAPDPPAIDPPAIEPPAVTAPAVVVPTVAVSPPPSAPAPHEPVVVSETDSRHPDATAPRAREDRQAAVPIEITSKFDVGSSEPVSNSSTESDSSPRRRRKRRKNRVPILAGMMVLPVLLLGLAIALRGRGPVEKPRPRPTRGIVENVPRVPDSRREVAANEPTVVNGYEIVESDRLLWVPPHTADSSPPPLALLPPGPAAIVSVPIARLIGSSDAEPVTSTFSTEIEGLIALAERRAGVDREQIARCTVALFPGKGGWPEVALAIDLTEPMELNTLTDKWNVQESRVADGVVVYAGEEIDDDAFFIGGAEKGKLAAGEKVQRFAVGSLKRIREVAEGGGGSIPLVRSMATLWNTTSVQSDFVALVTPNFLFADGRELVSSAVPEFRSPLKQWLIPNVAAFSMSATIKDASLYMEMREIPSGGATSATLLKSIRETIDAWPTWGDEFIMQSVPDPSWRLLATRLPLMMRYVGQQTRSTIIGETVVVSTYLPVDAGAQVALATLLAMNTAPGGVAVAQTSVAKPLTVDEMLDRPMSIAFLQLSLQFAVDAVADEFSQSLPAGSTMPRVRIVGGDLEKNGITQNQQISGFEREGRPLRAVLTDLVLGANPDKTASGPADPKQALVWVVHPQGKSPEETEILITTRDAAAGQYELPKEFQPTEE